MKITSVSRSRTYKVNLGSYENVVIGATVVAELEDGEDIPTAILNTQLDDLLRRDLANAYELTGETNSFVTSDEFADYR